MDGSHALSHARSQNAEFQDVASLPGWCLIDYLSTSQMFSSREETRHKKTADLKGELGGLLDTAPGQGRWPVWGAFEAACWGVF